MKHSRNKPYQKHSQRSHLALTCQEGDGSEANEWTWSAHISCLCPACQQQQSHPAGPQPQHQPTSRKSSRLPKNTAGRRTWREPSSSPRISSAASMAPLCGQASTASASRALTCEVQNRKGSR